MKMRKAGGAVALAFLVAVGPAALAKASKGTPKKSKSDKEQVITRQQWRGDAASFNVLDSNRDGIITRAEINAAHARRADLMRRIDTNNDYRVSRSEFPGTLEQFDLLDMNRDGYVTDAEVRNLPGYNGAAVPEDRSAVQFRGMDSNRDGAITRREWRGNTESFRGHDRNRDGVLSGSEVRGGRRE